MNSIITGAVIVEINKFNPGGPESMVLLSEVDSEYNPVGVDAMVLSENSTSERLNSNCISPSVDSSLSILAYYTLVSLALISLMIHQMS